jgi:hypothetical protein
MSPPAPRELAMICLDSVTTTPQRPTATLLGHRKLPVTPVVDGFGTHRHPEVTMHQLTSAIASATAADLDRNGTRAQQVAAQAIVSLKPPGSGRRQSSRFRAKLRPAQLHWTRRCCAASVRRTARAAEQRTPDKPEETNCK